MRRRRRKGRSYSIYFLLNENKIYYSISKIKRFNEIKIIDILPILFQITDFITTWIVILA